MDEHILMTICTHVYLLGTGYLLCIFCNFINFSFIQIYIEASHIAFFIIKATSYEEIKSEL